MSQELLCHPCENSSKQCVSDLYSYLKGKWSLIRQIHHTKGTCQEVKMSGIATFQPLEKPFRSFEQKSELLQLLYHEKGTVIQEEYQGTFEQSYFLAFNSENLNTSRIYFSSGDIFFSLNLSTGFQKVKHVCGPDLYQAEVRSFPEVLICKWHVEGPRKQYTLTTVLTKKRPVK